MRNRYKNYEKPRYIKVSPQGQLTLPKDIREEVDVEPGTELLVTVTKNEYLPSINLIPKPEPKDWVEWTKGIYKDVWKGIDVDKWLRKERDSWDEVYEKRWKRIQKEAKQYRKKS